MTSALKDLIDLAKQLAAAQTFMMVLLSILWLDTVLAWNGQGLLQQTEFPLSDIWGTLSNVRVSTYLLFVLATLLAWIAVLEFLAWSWRWMLLEARYRLKIERDPVPKGWMRLSEALKVATATHNDILFRRCERREREADEHRRLVKVVLGLIVLVLTQVFIVSNSESTMTAMVVDVMESGPWILQAALTLVLLPLLALSGGVLANADAESVEMIYYPEPR